MARFRFNPLTKKFDLTTTGNIPPPGTAITTLEGNSGGEVPPDAGGNLHTIGSGSITVVGSPGTNTTTAQLTGLTNHAVLVGAGTDTITNVGPGASDTVLLGNTGADPSFGQVPNAALVNSSITVTSPLGTITVGGSPVSLGGALTLDLSGGGQAIDQVAVQTGTSPVVPDGNGQITINGAVVAAGTNPVRSDGTGANTLAIEVQTSQAIAAADATKIGLCNFDSASFAVAATGFVTMAGGGGFTWNDVSGAFSPLKNNGYFITGTATGTLPASPSQGDTIKFFVDHASQVLTIDAPGTQIIRMGTAVSSAGGTFVSTGQGDSVELTYRASDTCWCAIAGFTGTWTFT